MSSGEFCTREVVIVERKSSIPEAARLMREYHVGDLVVVEKRGQRNIPVGIITDRDIVVEVIARGVDPDMVTAGDVMSRELVTVRENDGVWESLLQMCTKGIHRVPVINEEGALEGILAADDMIELLAEELTLLARISRRGEDRERDKLG
jgi:signal-transduction protein with cAMP-binding, CBS, and nucleotidyltransferase domain